MSHVFRAVASLKRKCECTLTGQACRLFNVAVRRHDGPNAVRTLECNGMCDIADAISKHSRFLQSGFYDRTLSPGFDLFGSLGVKTPVS